MTRRFIRQGLPAAGSTILATGAGVLTNLVTERWSWTLVLSFAVWIIAWIAFAMWWETSRSNQRPSNEDQPYPALNRRWISPPYVTSSVMLGRDNLLRTIMDAVSAPDGRPHILCGLAGIGKTTIALNVVAKCPAGMPIWWLNAADAVSLGAGLGSLANWLGAPGEEIRQSSSDRHTLMDLVWEKLHTSNDHWLLIVDNADDINLLKSRSRQVIDGHGLIRNSTKGLVLVTSRHADQSVWGSAAVVHKVEPLDARTGSRLLRDVAGKRAGSAADAAALVARFGGLPFGLMAAGQYLRSTEASLRGIRTFREYLRHLDHDLADHDAADPRRTMGAAWKMSVDHLASQGLLAAKPVVSATGLLASAPIPVDLATQIAVKAIGTSGSPLRRLLPGRNTSLVSTTQIMPTLARLCDLGMLSFVVATLNRYEVNCVTTHPLVAEVNQRELAFEPAKRTAISHIVIQALATVVTQHEVDAPAQGPWWSVAAVHIVHMLDNADNLSRRDVETLVTVANRAYIGLYCGGDHLNEVILTRKSADVAARVLGSDQPAELGARHSLAGTLAGQGNIEQAERMYRAVLVARSRVLGPAHLDTLETQHNLAGLLLSTGRGAEAELKLASVVAVRRQVLGDTDVETMRARHNLAAARAEQGKLAQAEQEFDALLTDRQHVLGDSNRETLLTRRRLALIFERLGRLDEAAAALRLAACGLRSNFGNEHPETLTTAHLLGRVLGGMGQADAAAAELRPVLVSRTRLLGPTHPQTVETAQLLESLF